MTLRRRLLYGLLIAVVLHVLVLGLLPRRPARGRPVVATPVRVRILVIRRHRPRHIAHKPKPVPKRKIVRAKITPRKAAGAKARGVVRPRRVARHAAAPPRAVRRHEVVKATPLPLAVASSVPSEAPPVAARGVDGAAADGPAVVGAGAAGTAEAGSGNAAAGTGAGDALIPCGDVDFTKIGRDRIENGMISHEMEVRVRTDAGTSVTEHVPYRFVYPSHEVDPYWDKNHGNTRILSLVQFPPSGFDRSTLGPVMRTVLAHSSPEGITLFPECGSADRR